MNNSDSLLQTPSAHRLSHLSKDSLIQQYDVLDSQYRRALREISQLKQQKLTDEQINLIVTSQLESLREELFGASSERYKKPVNDNDDSDPKTPTKPRIKKPSERYPNLPVIEQVIVMNPLPRCPCCNEPMQDSGMSEDSEQLTVIPKKFEIILQKRKKYRCSCQGAIVTAPVPARIIEGSSYSDEMIMDAALSKYCDLIPVNRYVAMAERAGVVGLPAHSVIETQHGVADLVSGAYLLVKGEMLVGPVVNADETPLRMLEGDEKKHWHLWGFSTPTACYLECRDTRSGDVASEILNNSKCEVLVTDVFSGYGKAIREANELRAATGRPLIKKAHCNAHARRYFFKAFPKYPEASFYLDHYHGIYRLNKKAKEQPESMVLELRGQMRPRFEAMKKQALAELANYPRNGKYGKALRYFLDNYPAFTLFMADARVPIDNNAQERSLRSHVVGRKTWYGTHSKRGALTAAILFTLVESCKLNQVNPREYFKHLVQDLLAGAKPYSPYQFKLSH